MKKDMINTEEGCTVYCRAGGNFKEDMSVLLILSEW